MIARLISALFALALGAHVAQGAIVIGHHGTPKPRYTSQIFNCTSFAASGGTTGTCGAGGSPPFIIGGTTGGSSPGISGSSVLLMPVACQHCALNLNFQTLVNVQAFETTFTFVSNGWNVSFIANNSNNNPFFNGQFFSAGAGCEGSFWQGFSQAAPPNNVFAVMLDSYSGLVAGSSDFTDSGVQIYNSNSAPANAPNGPGQSPCNPDLGNSFTCSCYTYVGVNKFATSPVHLNSPSNATFQTSCTGGCVPSTSGVGTGDLYSVTITYDGNDLSIAMFDITAGGSCPGATTCFTHTWTNVNIPAIVGGNTAWIGIGSSTADNDATLPLLIGSFAFANH